MATLCEPMKLRYLCVYFNQLLSRLTSVTFKLHIEITYLSRPQMLNRQRILLALHIPPAVRAPISQKEVGCFTLVKMGAGFKHGNCCWKLREGRKERSSALVRSYRSGKITSVTTHWRKLETDDPNSCQNLFSALLPHFSSAVSNWIKITLDLRTGRTVYDLDRQTVFSLPSDLNIVLCGYPHSPHSLDIIYGDWYLSQEGLYDSHFKKSSEEWCMWESSWITFVIPHDSVWIPWFAHAELQLTDASCSPPAKHFSLLPFHHPCPTPSQ